MLFTFGYGFIAELPTCDSCCSSTNSNSDAGGDSPLAVRQSPVPIDVDEIRARISASAYGKRLRQQHGSGCTCS